MIGIFDSGIGGLTILGEIAKRFPRLSFVYLGDHENVPIGEKRTEEIITLTRRGVEHLFKVGCRLVILGCNTATAVAARELQQNWLPLSSYRNRNLLGIIAPTVEAATQTPWAITSPQYPQKYNSNIIVVFGTPLTVNSRVYVQEIAKRCPKVRIFQQACAGLAGAIENGVAEIQLNHLVAQACKQVLSSKIALPDHAILGCTHYPIVEHIFKAHLPQHTRIFSQPAIVADSLDDYLRRHPQYVEGTNGALNVSAQIRFLTTGDPAAATATSNRLWPGVGQFEQVA